jgi:hypothetical protein
LVIPSRQLDRRLTGASSLHLNGVTGLADIVDDGFEAGSQSPFDWTLCASAE